MKHNARKPTEIQNDVPSPVPEGSAAAPTGARPHGPGPAAATPQEPPRKSLLRDAAIGVLLILILVLMKVSVEHARPLEHLSLATYDAIQSSLCPQEAPIVIVDITNLKSDSWTQGRNLTDRKTLGEVVALIVQEHPAAIGIDVDFSPDYDPLGVPIYHAPDRQDPIFFDSCLLHRRNGVPVYLGVFQSSGQAGSERLVRPEYAPLAADMRIDLFDNRLIPESFDWQANGDTLPSLSAAAAQAFRSNSSTVPPWLRWALRGQELSRLGHSGWVREFYVDFSPVDQLIQSRADFIDLTGAIDRSAFEAIRHKLRDKIVLLGAADPLNPKEGCFTIPGRRQAIPGIYLHAAAAYSLVRCPLLVLTPGGRIVVDVLLACIVVAAICLVRRRLGHAGEPTMDPIWQRRLPWMITLAAMGLAFVLGVLFVNLTRVIWDDFVIVFVALGLHVPMERQAEKYVHARRKRMAEQEL